MTNDEARRNSQMTKSKARSARPAKLVIGHSSLIRHSSCVIRHSSLVIGHSLFLLLLAFDAHPLALAQESPTPSPSPTLTPPPTPSAPPARTVRLRFALPPLDGTISLGIYDAGGKLVRVLHREDELDDFTAGNDALETDWDGTDNEKVNLCLAGNITAAALSSAASKSKASTTFSTTG